MKRIAFIGLAMLLVGCSENRASVSESPKAVIAPNDCLWGDDILAHDRNLDRQTAGRVTDPDLAAHYRAMSEGWEQVRERLALVCRGQSLAETDCATSLGLIGEGADSHNWYLQNPDGVSDFDLRWHQEWLQNYDGLARLFLKACPTFNR